MPNSRLLNIPKAAEYLGVSTNTMSDYVKMGIVATVALPARIEDGGLEGKTRSRALIDRSDLDVLIEQRKNVLLAENVGHEVGPKPSGPSGVKRHPVEKHWRDKYRNKRVKGEDR